jgi:octaprenyl-diphosphate synthase
MAMHENPARSVASLREAGSAERAGERVARRLQEVHALLGADMAWVDSELSRAARAGARPATDSAAHLLAAGGKRVRPLTALLAAACFDGITPASREIAVAAELVHLATLLHDDVIDDGQERRGVTTSRRIWGNAVSVLAGDLLLTHALERTSAAAPGGTLAELFATLRRLVDGEVVQLRGRTELDTREETYFAIVREKTAALFVWAARAGARSGGADEEGVAALGSFGEHIGLAFQLVDDALDYAGDARVTGKALHADLEEGKLTLPLLRALAREPALVEAVERVRAGDPSRAAEVAGVVHALGVCDDVRALARAETDAALAALTPIRPCRARDRLADVARELAARVS